MKRVDETKAGKSIAAFVILNPQGELIGKVQAHYSDGGRVTVNLWNFGEGETYQEGSAGGYGYDKFTAAISGMVVDGHELTNHCGARLPKPDGLELFPRDFKAPPGYSLANYRYNDDEPKGYSDCYKDAGLDYLRGLGYRVIQAI